MNTSQLKSYAPAARQAFMAAVKAQANRLAITSTGCEVATVQGDVLLIGGQPFPASIAEARDRLVKRVKAQGFEATMEAMAYTWFNRLIAIRFMEIQGYLDHGYRVLSHPEGRALPEILDYAVEIELPGLDREQAIALKLDGTKDEELYRLLLIAQCNALHRAMPFLFERIGDETELLLPTNLLNTDSLIQQLVESIDESAWAEIEVVGWLYQFYISERKDQVIGKVVASADIPAATQLFTPNWIVKYMVQNSLGAQWLATYPESPLRDQMAFYITPAEQSPEVVAQLREITPSSLDPEQLTLIDPACGSGHILVEAYDLLKAIYLERGYRLRDVPQLILEKNLFGLDIDQRAGQLAGFALMMKGRADDRRLFTRQIKLNVVVFEDSTDFDPKVLVQGLRLADYEVEPFDLAELKRLFENASVFGSLIQVPVSLAEKLSALRALSEVVSQDLFVNYALGRLGVLVRQAELLAGQYDVVVANPPYMGSKGMNGLLKKCLQENYKDVKSDLFSAFVVRLTEMIASAGFAGFMTPFTWMFLSSYEKLRSHILDNFTLSSLVKPSYTAFFDSAIVAICTYTIRKNHSINFKGTFFDLDYLGTAEEQAPRFLQRKQDEQFYRASAADFKKIPGSAIAYWVSQKVLEVFSTSEKLSDVSDPVVGLQTGDNDQFLRLWFEVSNKKIGFNLENKKQALESRKKWFPYNKGGDFRKWYGNQEYLVNWENDGQEIRIFGTENGGKARSRPQNTNYYFQESISWSKITSGGFSLRFFQRGFIFDVAGTSIFNTDRNILKSILGVMNSPVMSNTISAISPTLNYEVGQIKTFPIKQEVIFPDSQNIKRIEKIIDFSSLDWNAYERSWDFQTFPLLDHPAPTIETSYQQWIAKNRETIAEMKRLEEENNRLFIDAYGLQDELTPDVPIQQITLTVNPAYRYSKDLNDEEWSVANGFGEDLETRFCQDTSKELISYALGCMMGRYSLDKPGLIYAHSENKDFDPSQYATFPADDDGILPITDSEWFSDDAVNRLGEFIATAWDKDHLETNLKFLAENLSPKKGETSRETLRRYLCDNFYKDHLQTYKKRPIYWLFSSGKQKAFQCLVYLHRYNQGTLARMRTEYVIPLQGKLAARLETLQGDIQAADSTAHRKRLEKEQTKLQKQNTELLAFDEKLRYQADLRITLDLDDGVKVNYSKFGDLLAEVK
jgi:type II restriction/modification system DNA methylase subunit YeeA